MIPRAPLIWAGLAAAIVLPMCVAATSPLLQWRDPIYIVAGFAGIAGLALLLVQPLLILGALPGLRSKAAHFWTGIALTIAVILHVAGLWITSPPDVIDVLLFRSPTPFAIWGALAMWGTFAAALLGILRKKFRPRLWRLAHSIAAIIVVIGTVVHAWQIQGTMGTWSKAALCMLVLAAGILALRKRRVWRLLRTN